MSCQCYQIGGPFISFDPNCPAHGLEAQAKEREQEQAEIEQLREQEIALARELEKDRKIEQLEQSLAILQQRVEQLEGKKPVEFPSSL